MMIYKFVQERPRRKNIFLYSSSRIDNPELVKWWDKASSMFGMRFERVKTLFLVQQVLLNVNKVKKLMNIKGVTCVHQLICVNA